MNDLHLYKVDNLVADYDKGFITEGELHNALMRLMHKRNIVQIIQRIPAGLRKSFVFFLKNLTSCDPNRLICISGGIQSWEITKDLVAREKSEKQAKQWDKHLKKVLLPAIRECLISLDER